MKIKRKLKEFFALMGDFFSACSGLTDYKKVRQLHDYYLDLLAYAIEQNHVATHSRILIKIFQLLPMLVPINAESACIMNFNVDTPPG